MFEKWLIIDILESKKMQTIIYNVKSSINENIYLENKKWVMKLILSSKDSEVYTEEIDNIEKYELYNNPFCVAMPTELSLRSGIYENKSWYVMEKYDNNLTKAFLFGKNNMKLLISNVIDLIEWLHISKNRVHGDIKSDNILINFTDTRKPFCLADYESITKPNNNICIKNLPNGYYYYGYGCLSDKPYMSYRMDLQAFGYILWNLTTSVESYNKFNWQLKAFAYYDKNKINSEFDDLNDIRFMHDMNTNKTELIKSYFNIISEVDWFERNPNPDIYKRIRELIK